MRILLLPILIVLVISIVTDRYIYKAISRSGIKFAKILSYLPSALSIILGAGIIAMILVPNSSSVLPIAIYAYLCMLLPKLLYVIVSCALKVPSRGRAARACHIIGIAGGLALMSMMIHASVCNRYQLQINEVELSYPNLPPSFNGFKIVQFSDMHLASFGNDTAFVSKMVQTINNLHPDAIMFTGDLVSSASTEAAAFVQCLSQLSATHGVYSVLGNHDYGDYNVWPDDASKQRDRMQLRQYQQQARWNLLLNTTSFLHRGTDSIAVIGVENIGEPPFHCYGDLQKAYPNLNDSTFKILLSHNPTHWRTQVLPSTNIGLTLSGHTHAMQMDVEISGHHISPSSLRYQDWSGLYQQGSQYLYVNIGIGCVGIPARFGAKPEITLITLRSKK
ncbi:MAG: metallophosphoesterase [Muribaculaceae bacterium]